MAGDNGENIKFFARQRPSSILPGQGDTKSMDPLAEKARDRTSYSLEKVKEAIAGERPVLGGENKGGKWLGGQIREMVDQGFLLEHEEAYFARPRPEKVMGYKPASHYLIQEKDALRAELPEVDGVHVAGTGTALKRKGQAERQLNNARMVVALPGDLNALQEMLGIIERKFNGEVIDQPLIIENPAHGEGGNFWDEILRSLKILNVDNRQQDPMERRGYVDLKALAHHYGIYVTEERRDTIELAKTLDKNLPKKPALVSETETFPEGSIVFIATGTQKKEKELADIIKANHPHVRVYDIFHLVDTYVSPKELSGTYEGNDAEKARAALQAWHEMEEKDRVKTLEHLGITKDQGFILFEDSGFHFVEKDIVYEDEFGDIRHKVDPDAPFPGVETGPGTIGSNGIANFMERVNRVFSRRPHATREVVKKSVMGMMPLAQDDIEGSNLFMAGAEVRGTFSSRPLPSSGTVTIDHYLIPDAIPGQRPGLTEMQLGAEFVNHYSPKALAWLALASELGIPKTGPVLTHDYSKDFVAGIVTNEFNQAAYGTAKKLEAQAYEDGFGVVVLDDEITRAKDPQDKIFSKSDGIVLAFNPETAKEDFWKNLYTLTSAIVAEQTHDKFKLRKPLYLVNPDGAFDDLIKLIYDFHYLGTVPEEPETLIKQTKNVEEAVEKLQVDRKDYRRYRPPAYATQEEPFETDGLEPNTDFNVSVLLSASTENAVYLGDTRRLTRSRIENGMGIYSGGGAYGPMGALTKTAYNMRSTHRAFHGASNVKHIMSGEGDVRDFVQQFKKSRDIYERMEYIGKGDVFVMLPGGTGTVQELALYALLKEYALESDDVYAKEIMDGKDMIIVNREIEHMGEDRGFYDVLKEIIPEEYLEKLGIHFVDTVDEADQKCQELRDRKRAAMQAANDAEPPTDAPEMHAEPG